MGTFASLRTIDPRAAREGYGGQGCQASLQVEDEGVQWGPRTDERRRALLRARWLLWVALGAFALVAIGGLVVIVADPSRWWVWLIGFVLLGYVEVRNARRLRWVNRALRQEVPSETRT